MEINKTDGRSMGAKGAPQTLAKQNLCWEISDNIKRINYLIFLFHNILHPTRKSKKKTFTESSLSVIVSSIHGLYPLVDFLFYPSCTMLYHKNIPINHMTLTLEKSYFKKLHRPLMPDCFGVTQVN